LKVRFSNFNANFFVLGFCFIVFGIQGNAQDRPKLLSEVEASPILYEAMDSPNVPFHVLNVERVTDASNGPPRVRVTIQNSSEDVVSHAGLRLRVMDSGGACKGNVVFRRNLNSINGATETWTLVIRKLEPQDVLILIPTQGSTGRIREDSPDEADFVRRALDRRGVKAQGLQCRNECHQFDWDCGISCSGAAGPNWCVYCFPTGTGGSGPCEIMECYCLTDGEGCPTQQG